MSRILYTLLLVALLISPAVAQEADSLSSSRTLDEAILNRYMDEHNVSIKEESSQIVATNNYRDSHKFRSTQLALPLALIVAGTTSIYINKVDQFDKDVYNNFQKGRTPMHFDDYLQYAPFAMVWVLDACGVEPRHRFLEQTTNLAMSLAFMGILVNASKYTIKRSRPDSGSRNSMPSGHTAMAFTGAEFLRLEFRDSSPWLAHSGYLFAGTVAFMRLWNQRHYVTDVVVGAGVGILSARAAYWLAPCVNRLLWGSDLENKTRHTKRTLVPYTDGESTGVALGVTF